MENGLNSDFRDLETMPQADRSRSRRVESKNKSKAEQSLSRKLVRKIFEAYTYMQKI